MFDRIEADDYEQVVFCHHRATGLRAIVAVHSTALGPALGGTRFYPYTHEDDALEDVLRLARGMTYKAALAGLDLGGGKAVILGDPNLDKNEALLRAFARYVDALGGRYITAEDVGTTLGDRRVAVAGRLRRPQRRHRPGALLRPQGRGHDLVGRHQPRGPPYRRVRGRQGRLRLRPPAGGGPVPGHGGRRRARRRGAGGP